MLTKIVVSDVYLLTTGAEIKMFHFIIQRTDPVSSSSVNFLIINISKYILFADYILPSLAFEYKLEFFIIYLFKK